MSSKARCERKGMQEGSYRNSRKNIWKKISGMRRTCPHGYGNSLDVKLLQCKSLVEKG